MNTVFLTIVVFAVVMIAAESLPPQWLPAKTMTENWWYLKPVPYVLPDHRWVVTILDKNDPRYGQDVVYEFCPEGKDKDGKSKFPFKEGALVLQAIYREHGNCKELIHASFDRDEEKNIILKGVGDGR